MDFIDTLKLKDKSFLELGCGTAMIAVLAAKKGAIVTASDLHLKAVENAQLNAAKNQVNLKILHSDLFENIQEKTFDFICINPPYYPKNPRETAEAAWFCGSEYQYFKKLFAQLPGRFHTQTKVFMILSEDCDIHHIQLLAKKEYIIFEKIVERKNWLERNFIFQLNLDLKK